MRHETAKLISTFALLWLAMTVSKVVDPGSEFPLGDGTAVFQDREPAEGLKPGRVAIRTEDMSIYDIHKMTRNFELSSNGARFSCRTSGIPQHEIRVATLKSLQSPVRSRTARKGCRSVVVWGNERFCQDGARNPVVHAVLEACRQRSS